MGQWGALGLRPRPDQLPVDRRPTTTGDTTLAARPGQQATQVRVALTENDGNSVIVTSASRVHHAGHRRPRSGRPSRWPGHGQLGRLQSARVCGRAVVADPVDHRRRRHPVRPSPGADRSSSARAAATSPSAGPSRPLQLERVAPDRQHPAAGAVRGGVVPNESRPAGAPWAPPGPRVSRGDSRSWRPRRWPPAPTRWPGWVPRVYADTCDLDCQTYRGLANETALTDLAVSDTAGQVMEFPGGAVAATQYSASTGRLHQPRQAVPGGARHRRRRLRPGGVQPQPHLDGLAPGVDDRGHLAAARHLESHRHHRPQRPTATGAAG